MLGQKQESVILSESFLFVIFSNDYNDSTENLKRFSLPNTLLESNIYNI